MSTSAEDVRLLGAGAERASLLLLGPVALRVGTRALPLGGPVQRAVLTDLVLHTGRPLEVDRLLTDVWGPEAGDRAHRSLATLVSRLRRVLEPLGTTIDHVHGSYVLHRPPATDVDRFAELVLQARAQHEAGEGGPAGAALAVATLDDALTLWRGAPFADLDAPFAEERRTTLVESRWAAEDLRADLLVEAGDLHRAIAALEAMTTETPYCEVRWARLIDVLHLSGRRRDALHAFRRVDRLLRDELGIDPGPELRAAELQVLDDVGSGAGRRSTDVGVAVLGRKDQLRLLGDAVARARGRATAVLVVGAAGIGKTTLVRRTAAAASSHQRVVVGSCMPGSASVSATLVAPIAAAIHADGLARLGAAGADLHRLVTPGLGFDPDLLGLIEHRVVTAIHAAVEALLDEGPLLVVVEDVHWADRLTRRALDDLLSNFGDRPLSVVVSSRPEATLQDDWLRSVLDHPRVEVVEVDRLGDAEMHQLVATHGVPAEWVDDVVAAAGGVPIVGVELSMLVCERGTSLGDEVPDRLRRVFDLRFGPLPDHVGRLVRMAALDGAAARLPVVAAALELDPIAAGEQVDVAVGSGALVLGVDGTLSFPHELIRSYFVGQMGVSAVTAGRLALVRAHAEFGEAVAAARHAEHVGDQLEPVEQFELLVDGTRAALDSGAADDATRWAGTALGIHARLEVAPAAPAQALGSALVSLGRLPDGRRVLIDACRGAADEGRWDVVTDALDGVARTGQPQQGPDLEVFEDLIGRGLSALEGDDVRTGRLASLAFHLYSTRDPRLAAAHLAVVEEIGTREPSMDAIVEVCRYRFEVEHGPEPAGCVRRGPRLVRRMEERGDAVGAAIARLLLLAARLRAGYPVTGDDLDAVRADGDLLGRPDMALVADLVGSLCATWNEPAHRADSVVEEAVGRAMATGDPVHLVTGVAHTFSLRREQQRAAELLPALQALSSTYDHPSLDCFTGMCHVEQGDLDAARSCLESTWDGLAELDDEIWTFAPLVAHAVDLSWSVGSGVPAALAERVDRALGAHASTMLLFASVVMHLGPTDRHRARVALMAGDVDQAVRLLRAAGTLARRAGLELWARWCDVDLADALGRTGDPGAAAEAEGLLAGARRAAQRGGWPRLGRAATPG
ncbi:BTAD domain-containing putative transcriptional regulator [Dermatobacter hominis]|uniref:BTAD domain-containing putative transcriptional regulator n=1 Tax=Dermatobacter hominis TaxID=2884263 RepID=UPI001D100139|nr:BTAD domain-containing putative transcriptional regulator [Dermatobacter hominis]UDY37013.1 AAA family ATPase [Dermatobacter hominis]